MRFWGKFSKNIFKFVLRPQIRKIQPKLLEAVMVNSILMLDSETIGEVKSFLVSKQTDQGGFSDRGGNGDLYYSLFGYYIAEALSVSEVMEPLKKFVAETVTKSNLSGVYLYCGAILYSKLIGSDATTEKLRKQIVTNLVSKEIEQPDYSGFLGILALYYLEDYQNIQRAINQYKRFVSIAAQPCPVIAATAVILGLTGTGKQEYIEILKSFYRKSGGFAALQNAPSEDLLSTGVALYALHFLDADIRIIKPDCISFVDNMYDNGGFKATQFDSITDVEYTFYGLLSLGSMS
jgi:hypothetical protein